MVVGTILLDINNKYVDDKGDLPVRPVYDKELLAKIIKGKKVSSEGYDMLPPSLRKLVDLSSYEWCPITIPELAEADVLIVVRSPIAMSKGKVFRLDNFKKYGYGNPEIYIR